MYTWVTFKHKTFSNQKGTFMHIYVIGCLCVRMSVYVCARKCEFTVSVQFSCSVMSDSLQTHGLQHTRPHCPSPTPRAYSNSGPLSQWCHPTVSSCHPLLLPASIFSRIMVFSNESFLHIRWPKYWSFSFNISPSNEHPGLISFRMHWFDLLAVRGNLKSLLQNHSSKHQFFGAQLF